MTREEAIKWFKESPFYHKDHEPFDMAIKALEQEPCEDAVSRKAVINQIFYSTDNSGDVVLGSALRERIEKLPSVTPQEPKSEWQQDHEILKAYSDVANEVLDKIRAEIERQERWLMDTGYNACSVDIAFDAIKSVIAESGGDE